MPSCLTIANDKEFYQFRSDKIIYVTSDGNYSTIHMGDQDARLVTLQLGQIENLLGEQLGPEKEKFIRIGRSLIVNSDYIYHVYPRKKELLLSDSDHIKVQLEASVEALNSLKIYLETEFCKRINGRD